jgi:hypothetical protein
MEEEIARVKEMLDSNIPLESVFHYIFELGYNKGYADSIMCDLTELEEEYAEELVW